MSDGDGAAAASALGEAAAARDRALGRYTLGSAQPAMSERREYSPR